MICRAQCRYAGGYPEAASLPIPDRVYPGLPNGSQGGLTWRGDRFPTTSRSTCGRSPASSRSRVALQMPCRPTRGCLAHDGRLNMVNTNPLHTGGNVHQFSDSGAGIVVIESFAAVSDVLAKTRVKPSGLDHRRSAGRRSSGTLISCPELRPEDGAADRVAHTKFARAWGTMRRSHRGRRGSAAVRRGLTHTASQPCSTRRHDRRARGRSDNGNLIANMMKGSSVEPFLGSAAGDLPALRCQSLHSRRT